MEGSDVLKVVKDYAKSLQLLDDYDHLRIKKPMGKETLCVLSYHELRNLINAMSYNNESDLFGKEKDDSFKSSIATIYSTFDGVELYESIEEKAANLLYFVTKNHSFVDGNKRIAAVVFLYFLDKNQSLYNNKTEKKITDETLVAITVMIATSNPSEKNVIVDLVMNLLNL